MVVVVVVDLYVEEEDVVLVVLEADELDVLVVVLLVDDDVDDVNLARAEPRALPRVDVHDSALAMPALIVSDPNTSAPASVTLVNFLSLPFAICALPFLFSFRITQIHRGNQPAAPADHSLR